MTVSSKQKAVSRKAMSKKVVGLGISPLAFWERERAREIHEE
jgi:hypothetical protein